MGIRGAVLAAVVVALSGTVVVPVATAKERDRIEPGCQPDRRTVVHGRGEVVDGTGDFTPCVVDTGMTSGESGLAIAQDGTLLRSVATNPIGIAVSSDDGASWERRLLPEGTSRDIADGWIDPVTGRYFYTGAGDSPVHFSDDQGRTWRQGTVDSPLRQDWNRVFSGPPPVPRTDGYPTNIYYCNWTVPAGVATPFRCWTSTDGGETFVGTGKDVYAPEVCDDPRNHYSPAHGRGVVDPRDGTIYLPVNMCGHLEVAISRDAGQTWTRRKIDESKSNALWVQPVVDTLTSPAWQQGTLGGRPNPVGSHMQVGQTSDGLAMDGTGRLYAVWMDDEYLPKLATSADGGQTWTPAARVSPPDVVQAVLPSVTVTRKGRVGISYYGTDDGGETWTGYLTVTDDAAALTPTFQTAAVSRPDEPLIPEPCCSANGLQEYTVARWAPDGSLWAAFFASTPSGDPKGVLGRLVPA
jgi:hypothetical protein